MSEARSGDAPPDQAGAADPIARARAEFQEIAGPLGERWRHCDDQPEQTLLRLAVLRDLMRELHSQKSRCLATGKRNMAQAFRPFEDRILELRSEAQLRGSLIDAVLSPTPVRKRTRTLPEGLFNALPREKLERYDRTWEQQIAAEACSLNWRVWALDAWVEITLAEEWNTQLGTGLWPSGVILFTESAPTPTRGAPAPTSVGDSPLWQGRWIILLHPRFSDPNEMGLGINQWPGSPPESPSPPTWKPLFTPKAR